MKPRLSRIAVAILILILTLNIAPTGIRSTPTRAQTATTGWVEVKPATLPPYGSRPLAYDSTRHMSVNFAGEKGTWEFDGTNWTQKTTVNSPSAPVLGAQLVYDTARKRVVLFGGTTSDYKELNETWEYDGTNWTQKTTATAPPARSDYAMTYDSDRGRTVLFGGRSADSVDLNDTWEYDGNNWVQKTTAASPSLRSGPAMTYDSLRRRVVLFGGRSFSQNLYSGDTWEYDGDNWIQKSTAIAPSPRSGAGLAFDSARGVNVLFGGASPNRNPDNPSDGTLNDTWEYNGTSWSQVKSVTPASSPPDRAHFGFAYDSGRGRLVLHGGGSTILDMPSPEPNFNRIQPLSSDHSPVAHPMFGGGEVFNDTWEYIPPSGGSQEAQLVITKVEFLTMGREPSTPTVGERSIIRVTIESQGARQPAVWGYSGEYSITGDTLKFAGGSTGSSGGIISSLVADRRTVTYQDYSLTATRWFLEIHADYGKAANPGQLQITIRPKLNVPALSITKSIVVGDNSSDVIKCSFLAAKVLASTLSGGDASAGLNIYAGLGTASQCQNIGCATDAIMEMLVELLGGRVTNDNRVALGNHIGTTILAVGKLNDQSGVGECYRVADWQLELSKAAKRRGIPVNMAIVHSPANILVTNQEKQRVGVLDNGSIVKEIPGSDVAIVGTDKYVYYPPTSATTTRLKGTGSGTMTVEMITSDGNKEGHEVVYKNVPVTRKLVAQVSSSDAQATLKVDTNGDGRTDQNRRPDVMHAISIADTNSRTFAETGKVVSGPFWQMWQGDRLYADSLYINGLPLTDKRPEVNSTDGKSYQTQWFERSRFEEHPENQPPFDVLLGLMGTKAMQGREDAAFQPVPDPGNGFTWFKETGHTLGDASEGGLAIAAFWLQLGGLQQFGYPLSQPFGEVNKENGKTYLVQYFERQRFEYHPENKGTQYEVLLGRLGAEQLNKK